MQILGSRLGSTFVDGGIHPRFGTLNFTAPLAGGQYIYVVCPLEPPSNWSNSAGQGSFTEGGGWLTWVFSTEDIAPFEAKFGRDAVDWHRTRQDGSDLKWKQIGVKEITDSRELPFSIQWLTEDHLSKDGTAVSKIEKIVIADTDQLAESWFKSEILGTLDNVIIDWVDPSANHGDNGIVKVHLSTPNGSVVLD